MANLGMSSSPMDELILSEKRQRDHRRMWAAVNLREFRNRFDWTEEERDELADMLGLTEEMKWVKS